jgi:hypothetical protein
MKKIAFLFPGQGSQSTGMGRDAAGMNTRAAGIFDEADATLGFSLSKLCFDGPDDALRPTEITQPALYTASAATLAILREAGIERRRRRGAFARGILRALCRRRVRIRDGAQAGAHARAGDGRGGGCSARRDGRDPRIGRGPRRRNLRGSLRARNRRRRQLQRPRPDRDQRLARSGRCRMRRSESRGRKTRPRAAGQRRVPFADRRASRGENGPRALDRRDRRAARFSSSTTRTSMRSPLPNAIRDSLVRQITSPVRWVETMTRLAGRGHRGVRRGRQRQGAFRACASLLQRHPMPYD